MTTTAEAPLEALRLSAYSVPTATFGTERPESDGTASWDATGVLVAEVQAGGRTGLGYAYASAPAALAIARDVLSSVVLGASAFSPGSTWMRMVRSVRNAGRPGVASSAVSAVDIALRDLQARLFDTSLVRLLGGRRDRVMAYGSGGFTDYDDATLRRQLGGWAAEGLRAVKLKIGSNPPSDPARVRAAREAVGPDVELFADANGAYTPRQALGVAQLLAESDVRWFEEPVSSDDLPGMRLVRDRAPTGMDIAAGEYGYTPRYFRSMLGAGSVDVLQADATRCGGVTGYCSAAAQAEAAGVRLSAHTSPALHASLGAALDSIHVEYFHDHVRIEELFLDGRPRLEDGDLVPDASAPGHGLAFKHADAAPYLTAEWRSS